MRKQGGSMNGLYENMKANQNSLEQKLSLLLEEKESLRNIIIKTKAFLESIYTYPSDEFQEEIESLEKDITNVIRKYQ